MDKIDQAKNPNTPQETLKVLATDSDWRVRRWVAKNPNTPQEILEVLATCEYYWIRYDVANNPNATELIRRLVLMMDHKSDETI